MQIWASIEIGWEGCANVWMGVEKRGRETSPL
jgi:hypothetical protein